MSGADEQLIECIRQELEISNINFRLKLKACYPKLTGYEMRLCTYLKSNLSTKEIALLLNITPDSVKKAKHRLRKKMGLGPWESFFDHFMAGRH